MILELHQAKGFHRPIGSPTPPNWIPNWGDLIHQEFQAALWPHKGGSEERTAIEHERDALGAHLDLAKKELEQVR